jgi:hypothetical protein
MLTDELITLETESMSDEDLDSVSTLFQKYFPDAVSVEGFFDEFDGEFLITTDTDDSIQVSFDFSPHVETDFEYVTIHINDEETTECYQLSKFSDGVIEITAKVYDKYLSNADYYAGNFGIDTL